MIISYIFDPYKVNQLNTSCNISIDFISKLIPKWCDKYRIICLEKENLKLEYLPSVKDDFKNKENFVNQLEKNFEREIEKGVTLIGPHRDDFEIFLNDKSIKKYGSQGQMRTCVLKLKLSECEIIKNELKREPVLLLDDILSELDEKRKEFFLNNIKDKQIFITTTEKEIIKNSSCKYFHVSDGKIIN